jgi:hypothetical protein
MLTLRSVICASVIAVPLCISTSTSAAVIAGNSGGTFSNITNCDDGNCRRNDTANGNNTQLEWGHTTGRNGIPGSTLTGVNRTWNQSTNANDLVLAELVWYNKSTASDVTPDVFGARYTLGINFISPNVAIDTEPFQLTITNTTNVAGDRMNGLLLADLENLSFNLNGIIMSDLKYMLGAGGGSFSNNIWYNPEDTTSRLFITADFTDQTIMLPEPASLGLLAIGLLGLGRGISRRRQA